MQVCRTCLRCDNRMKTVPKDMIFILIWMADSKTDEEKEEDPMMWSICYLCEHSLQKILDFRELCIRTQKFWRKKCLLNNLSHFEFPDSDCIEQELDALEKDSMIRKLKRGRIINTFNNLQGSDEFVVFVEESKNHLAISVKSETRKDPLKINLHPHKPITSDDLGLNIQPEENVESLPVLNIAAKFGPIERKTRQTIKIDDEDGLEVNLSLEEQRAELKERSMMKNYLNAKFKCETCVMSFRSEETLKNHMEKHSESRGDVICELCQVRFDTKRRLQIHARLHSFRVECRLCGARLKDRNAFTQHMDLHNDNIYECDDCLKEFKLKSLLERHIVKHHLQMRYRCKTCQKIFKTKGTLRKHNTSHAASRTHSCHHCGERFPRLYYFIKHLRTFHKSEYHCMECDIKYKDEASYKTHLAMSVKHKDPEKFIHHCKLCGRRFETDDALEAHVESFHERVSRFCCEKCGQNFVTKMGLSNHMKTKHEGYKPPLKYSCSECNKSFSTKSILVNHFRTHTGERPFKCGLCPHRFSQRSAMRTHYKIIHLGIKREIKKKSKMEEKDSL